MGKLTDALSLNMKEWLVFHGLYARDHIQQVERIKTDEGYPKA